VSIETIIALYEDTGSSRQVLEELHAAGFKNEFWIFGDTTQAAANESAGTNPFNSAKQHYNGADSETAVLTQLGVPETEANAYIEDVKRGGVLLIGQVYDDRAKEVRDILGRHNPARTTQPAG
jgi:hypothetical protein